MRASWLYSVGGVGMCTSCLHSLLAHTATNAAQDIAACCLFLGGKVEETPKKIRDVVVCCAVERTGEAPDENSEVCVCAHLCVCNSSTGMRTLSECRGQPPIPACAIPFGLIMYVPHVIPTPTCLLDIVKHAQMYHPSKFEGKF